MNHLTQREADLARSALDFLHSLEGAQVSELQVHAAILRDVAVIPKPSASEVESIVKSMDARQWIVGTPGFASGKMKWSISDAGEAARLRLN
ncbi:MAG TPA: hypothetical protein VG347_00755 [Verrucomicrobiae bacterium]|nr:hypothetical protein [Verrucomicrobiae bacterium]